MPATAPSPADNTSPTNCTRPTFSRVGRFRRLSQLRNYTQNHLSQIPSTTSSNHRISQWTRAIGLSQPRPSRSSEGSSTAGRSSRPASENICGDSRQCAGGNGLEELQERTLPGSISGTSSLGNRASQYLDSDAPTLEVERGQNPPAERMARHRTSTATNGPAVHIQDTAHTSAQLENPTTTLATESSTNMGANQVDGGITTRLQDSRNAGDSDRPKQPATIRFYAYQDPQNSRPSLAFTPMTRTLPTDTSVIRVGRYSERDGIPIPNPTEPSDEPVGFKSKVVSRKHCEFSLVNGQWHIRDVGSSSGTFLNHMRLSQPNMESRHYSVRDGDIVQLGIDFRGGEETIFRSVRIRIECNRMWQQQANEFKYISPPTSHIYFFLLFFADTILTMDSKNTETLISNLGKGNAEGYAGCRECSICLGSVLVCFTPGLGLPSLANQTPSQRPYQCLFMAACAHVWHYKCIRRLIHTPEYPMFQCPNCRAYTDLSAEVDDSNDAYEPAPTIASNGLPMGEASNGGSLSNGDANHSTGNAGNAGNAPRPGLEDANLAAITEHLNIQAGGEPQVEDNPRIDHEDEHGGSNASEVTNIAERRTPHGPNIVIPDPGAPVSHLAVSSQNRRHPPRSETPISEHMEDGPLTPRNDSGPLAFDGHAGRL